MWKNKKVLVTGSEGMIGKELVIQLKELEANVTGFDIKDGNNVLKYDHGHYMFDKYKPEYVFHLFGIKGNPKKTKEKPVDFMGPMLMGDTNIICLAQKYNIKRFLYTSSIAVENPESDKYPAWAKRTAETLIEAMRIQYPKGTKYCIVRPSNVYGRFDNFNTGYPMVVTSLIKKAMKDGKLILDEKGCWQERDFINAKDVARGMIKCMEEMPTKPVNLCSGKGKQINQLALIISKELNTKLEYTDLKLTLGPNKKVMKLNWDFKPEISLEEGIKEVIKWMNK